MTQCHENKSAGHGRNHTKNSGKVLNFQKAYAKTRYYLLFFNFRKAPFASVGADPCVRPQGKISFRKNPMRIRPRFLQFYPSYCGRTRGSAPTSSQKAFRLSS